MKIKSLVVLLILLFFNVQSVYAQSCQAMFLSTTDEYGAAFRKLKRMSTLKMDHEDRVAMYQGDIKERAQKFGAYVNKDGKISVGGEPLSETGWYTGVILKDGSIIIAPRAQYKHNELVAPGDKVVSAFELRGLRGGVKNFKFLMLNQSGTFKPSYQSLLKSLDIWSILHNAPAGIWKDFKISEYKN